VRELAENPHWPEPSVAPGNDVVRIKGITVLPESSADGLISMQTPIRVETEFWILEPNRQIHLTYHLLNDQGIVVLTSGSPTQVHATGLYRAVCYLPGNLLNMGDYYLKLLVVENGNKVTFTRENIVSFGVLDTATREEGSWMGREPGIVQPHLNWSLECVEPAVGAIHPAEVDTKK
jgi:lipopolysaccharide transport system ATP-binding protein